jgi:hypothetical protein
VTVVGKDAEAIDVELDKSKKKISGSKYLPINELFV